LAYLRSRTPICSAETYHISYGAIGCNLGQKIMTWKSHWDVKKSVISIFIYINLYGYGPNRKKKVHVTYKTSTKLNLFLSSADNWWWCITRNRRINHHHHRRHRCSIGCGTRTSRDRRKTGEAGAFLELVVGGEFRRDQVQAILPLRACRATRLKKERS
jgi:hypothetical protein